MNWDFLIQNKESLLVSTDTRNLPAGCVFFALHGERFDGNKFALQALEAGASLVVIDDPEVYSQLSTLNSQLSTFNSQLSTLTSSSSRTPSLPCKTSHAHGVVNWACLSLASRAPMARRPPRNSWRLSFLRNTTSTIPKVTSITRLEYRSPYYKSRARTSWRLWRWELRTQATSRN